MPSVSPVSQRATTEPNWETNDPVILYICKYTVEVHDSFKCAAADISVIILKIEPGVLFLILQSP